MSINEKVLFFLEETEFAVSMKELAKYLQMETVKDFKILVQEIAKLERSEKIKFDREGKILTANNQATFEGVFRGNERGFGFVDFSEGEDAFIPEEKTNFAMDGDLVKFTLEKSAPSVLMHSVAERQAEGIVIKIVKRSLTRLVGIFVEETHADFCGYVISNNKKLKKYRVYIKKNLGLQPSEGSVVLAEITKYPDADSPKVLQGVVQKLFGHKDDLGMDVLEIVYANGIVPEFPEEVLREAAAISDTITDRDEINRRDLRSETIVTIDGADSKDLDDAVAVARLKNGNFSLGVHIADVSHYVKEGSALDKEAYERATSIYLADLVIPMLPTNLSNGSCSLNPGVSRLTLSCSMEIDQKGEVVNYEIFPSIIESKARMTYTEVNNILEENEKTRIEVQKLTPMLKEMAELHYILEKKRFERGAINFDEREAEISLDEKGLPIDFQLRKRGCAQRLIESFMLEANETVAKYFAKLKLPFLYRIHEHPKSERLTKFFDFITLFGLTLQGTVDSVEPKQLQGILEQIKGSDYELIVQMMLLRSMQQARYSKHNHGHYGLALQNYTHFTSPIRRYPDLFVHRLIVDLAKSKSKKNYEKWADSLSEIAKHVSSRERRSVDVERAVQSLKKAEFMTQHLGVEFSGIISSIMKAGFFVELPNTIEGFVALRSIETDYFNFMERSLTLVGERTHQVFKIGQKVVVRAVRADVSRREIEFALISAESVQSDTSLAKKKKVNRRERRKCNKRKNKIPQNKFVKNYHKKIKVSKQKRSYIV